MGLMKNLQTLNVNQNNSDKAILDHIATGKRYLVHELIPHGGTNSIEHILNLFFEHGYAFKTMSTTGPDIKSMGGRELITLIFEKM